MPRDWSIDLQNIHKAYKRRDALDLYLADNTVLRLSRGKVVRTIGGSPVTYDNWIRSVEDLRGSFDQSIDRITVKCQNVDSQLGFKLASDLRLLDFAVADYGKIYQSLTNPSLIEDIPQVFRGVLANADVDEENFKVELIVDYDSMGRIVAARAMSPRGQWCHQNGIECTATLGGLTCPQTRIGCKRNGREYEHGGWEFFEEPSSKPPGSGTNQGGGIGGPCFLGETLVWTPQGEIPIGEMKQRFDAGFRSVYSFDKMTGEIIEDEIDQVWKHEIPYTARDRETNEDYYVSGYFTIEFEHGEINVTPEHRFLTSPGVFTRVADFSVENVGKETSRAFVGEWIDSRIKRIKWTSDKTDTVWNLKVKRNATYFANKNAVSNSKDHNDGGIV